MLRKAIRLGLGATALMAAAFGAVNAYVLLAGRGAATSAAAAPRAEAAIVLGAQVLPDGRLSAMLEDRVAAGVELYRAGRVGKLLLSGDHGRQGYDEVGGMRRRALDLGVPARDVFTDHAGFNTWDSVVRARRVFGVQRAVVVTQRSHLPRALFLARRAGLEAEGLVADRSSYGERGRALQLRETLARVKSFGESTLGREPRFLGPLIPIRGDGRASWGP